MVDVSDLAVAEPGAEPSLLNQRLSKSALFFGGGHAVAHSAGGSALHSQPSAHLALGIAAGHAAGDAVTGHAAADQVGSGHAAIKGNAGQGLPAVPAGGAVQNSLLPDRAPEELAP